jgi:hypothetical protein
MAVGVGIDFSGNAQVCGYNHRGNTPTYTDGVHGVAPANCVPYETGSSNLPGSWSGGTVTSGGSASQAGSPLANSQNQAGFYAGPWEALGLGQSEFFSWVGARLSSMPGGNPAGIFYLDNNSITQDQSGAFSAGGGNGEGFLYVDGDLAINSNFTWRGVIYVEGDLKINGNSWILGALIVRGKGRTSNGSMTVLYSSEAVSTTLAKYGGQFTTLSWREVP